jgi:hypothetical protein
MQNPENVWLAGDQSAIGDHWVVSIQVWGAVYSGSPTDEYPYIVPTTTEPMSGTIQVSDPDALPSITLTGLSPSTTYLFQLNTTDNDESTAFSPPVIITTPPPSLGCNMTGAWLDFFNFQWTLNQDEAGNITGQVVGVMSDCPPQPWAMTGSVATDNSFVLSTTCPCDPTCATADQCQNFTYTGTLTPDCNSGSGTWTNCQVGSGTFTIVRTAGGLKIELQPNGGKGPGSPVSAWK